MKMNNYSDWEIIRVELQHQLKQINYNPGLHKIFRNIENMVGDLSRVAVDARRTKNSRILVQKLEEINQAIDQFEKLLFYAMLIE